MGLKTRYPRKNIVPVPEALEMEAARFRFEGRYPGKYIDRALRITTSRLDSPGQSQVQDARAFFRAVLRRLVLESKPTRSQRRADGRDAAARRDLLARLAISSLVSDLKQAGFSRPEIYLKVLESFSGKVSPELLEEYRKILVSQEEGPTLKAS